MNKLTDLWITESIRLSESQSGTFDDSSAMRKAKTVKGSFADKIIARAQSLAQRDQLDYAQKRWLQSAKISLLLSILVAIFTSGSLTLTALSTNPINIFWLLSSLLGLNFLSLFFWLFSLFFLSSANIHSLSGRLWLWLTNKFSRQGRQLQLMPALMLLLEQKHAARWLISCITHLFWLTALSCGLVILILLFSVKHYNFIWQTTLLGSMTMVDLIHVLSWLPAQLGFPLPDVNTIIKSGSTPLDTEQVRHLWAVWLIGIYSVYGIIPRILLLLFCWFYWMISCRNIQLDLSLPYYQVLMQRFQQTSQQIGVIDSEHAKDEPIINTLVLLEQAFGKAIVAIEMDEKWHITLPEDIHFLGNLTDRFQRKICLDALQHSPVNALLVICDAYRSPDRGIKKLLMELKQYAKEMRILLLNESEYRVHWQEMITLLNLLPGDLVWLEHYDG